MTGQRASDPLPIVVTWLNEHGYRDEGALTYRCPVRHVPPAKLEVLRDHTGGAASVTLRCGAGCSQDRIFNALGPTFSEIAPLILSLKESSTSAFTAKPSPCPCITPSEDESAELYRLIEAHKRLEIAPYPVPLAPLPEHAGESESRVAQDIALLIGLRLADGDPRPLPYSVRFCCRRMGWDEGAPMKASRVLGRLERWGIVVAGKMPPRPGVKHATKTYSAPLLGGEWAEVSEVPQGVVIEPVAEVVEQFPVNGA